MRIGQDVSIQVCRDEGYMVMDYPVYKLRKDPIETDCRFTRSLPEYVRESIPGTKIIYIDTYLNWNDLWKMYQENKKGIDSMIGESYRYNDCEEPYKILNLAMDIDMYCGLI